VAEPGVPVSVQALVPVFWKTPKFWYWTPIAETSNDEFVEPPSLKVSRPLKATTLPEIDEPA
jgi:hypothetical protein